MRLRKATAADLDELVRIEQSGDVRWGMKGLEQALANSHVVILIAEDEEKAIAGYIAVLIVAEEMQVQNIVVDTTCRRLGIGTILLGEACGHANSQGAREVFLEVATHNSAALSLYEKLGFRRTGTRPGFYQDGSDAAVMQKSLYPVE